MSLIEMSGIRKSFDSVRALDLSAENYLEINCGEVWAFAGENGAGKSTLANVISGITKRDGGMLKYKGIDYNPRSILDAQALGIHIVLQEPDLVPSLTIAENMFIRRERDFVSLGLLMKRKMNLQSRDIMKRTCPHLEPSAFVRDLSFEDQKLVETARAISMHPNCVIFDETSAALSKGNKLLLFDIIRRLKADGIAVVIVTHRMNEIFEITDKILVLKDGRFAGVRETWKTTPAELSELMVGRDVDLNIRISGGKNDTIQQEELLKAENLCVKGSFEDVNFRLKRCEIIGIGGMAGIGQDRLLKVIYGLERPSRGIIKYKGRTMTSAAPRASLRQGICYGPKNRDREGLILRHKIRENIVLPILGMLSIYGLIRAVSERKLATKLSTELNIKSRSIEEICLTLSGGNRQKVVLAKLLATKAEVFLLDNPTRGIDIGARAEIYRLMNMLTANGAGILMVSDELTELLQMSDTIILLKNGSISKTFDRRDNPSEEDLIKYIV